MARGESDQGRAAAEAAARAGVAAQISARIEATLEVETRSDGGQEAQQIRNHVRSRSVFAHGELIEVPADQVRCEGRVCVALAVLDRARADDVLAVAYAEAAGRFRRASEAAEAASIVAYTRHLSEADQAWEALAPIAGQRQIIRGAAPREVVDDRARRAALSAGRDGRLGTLRLTVLAGRLASDAVGEAARDALVGALTQAGLAARKADTCADGLAVVPAGTVACDTGSFGPRCTLPLTAELQPCPGGPPLATLDLRSARLTGVSPHTEDDARSRLTARISADRLAAVVVAAIHPLLPLP
ncbi:MAG: hypothetical protein R3F60_12965 [bacterium]